MQYVKLGDNQGPTLPGGGLHPGCTSAASGILSSLEEPTSTENNKRRRRSRRSALIESISLPDSREIAVAHVKQQSFGLPRSRKPTTATVIADIAVDVAVDT